MDLEELKVLEGKNFVIMKNGKPNFQGEILKFISKDFVKVQFFEWFLGYESNKEIIPFEFDKFRFFDTDEEMRSFIDRIF